MTCSKQYQIEAVADLGFVFSLNLENTWYVELDTPADFGASTSVIFGALPPGVTSNVAMFSNDLFTWGALGLGGTPTLAGEYFAIVRVSAPVQLINVKITVLDTPLDTVSWDMVLDAPTIVGSNYVSASVSGGGSAYNFETELAGSTAADVTMSGFAQMQRIGRSTSLRNSNLNLAGVVSGLGGGTVTLTQYIDAGLLFGVQLANRNFGNPPVNANDVFTVGGGTTYLVASYVVSMQQAAVVVNPSNYDGTVTFS